LSLVPDDPVKVGIVASYNRPGGNATGISAITSQIGTQRIQVLHQFAPRSKVALLMNPNNPSAAMEQHDAEAAATILGQKSLALHVTTKTISLSRSRPSSARRRMRCSSPRTRAG
jgi:putative tryptophan/tyrosine transport system substrate-binding protein